MMTSVDALTVDKDFHCPDYIGNAQNEVVDDILWFDNMGFYEWATHHEFPLGKDNNHPLEDAHQEAFEYVKRNHDFTK